jgi:hypothetical protein
MSFATGSAPVPTSIGKIVIVLTDGEGKAASYDVYVLDQNNNRIHVPGDQGDLVPHLSPADITWLLDFVSRMRDKAEAELLP